MEFLNSLKGYNSENSSFKVPNAYFDNLSEQIQAKLIEDSLKSLKNVSSTVGLKTPPNYVDELANSILLKREEKKVITLFSIKNMAYAASVLLVIGLGFVFFNPSKTNEVDIDEEVKLLAANIEPYESLEVTDFFNEISAEELPLEGIDFESELNLNQIIEEESTAKEIVEEEITTEDLNLDLIDFSDDFDLF